MDNHFTVIKEDPLSIPGPFFTQGLDPHSFEGIHDVFSHRHNMPVGGSGEDNKKLCNR